MPLKTKGGERSGDFLSVFGGGEPYAMWTHLTMIETAPCVPTVSSALLVLDGSGQSCNGHEGAHECKFFDFRRMLEMPEFAQAVPFSERSWRSYLLHSVRNGKGKKLVICPTVTARSLKRDVLLLTDFAHTCDIGNTWQ